MLQHRISCMGCSLLVVIILIVQVNHVKSTTSYHGTGSNKNRALESRDQHVVYKNELVPFVASENERNLTSSVTSAEANLLLTKPPAVENELSNVGETEILLEITNVKVEDKTKDQSLIPGDNIAINLNSSSIVLEESEKLFHNAPVSDISDKTFTPANNLSLADESIEHSNITASLTLDTVPLPEKISSEDIAAILLEPDEDDEEMKKQSQENPLESAQESSGLVEINAMNQFISEITNSDVESSTRSNFSSNAAKHINTIPNTRFVSNASSPPEFQFIHECGCRRRFFYSLENFGEFRINSSCSDEGTYYFPSQRVLSFALPRVSGPLEQNHTVNYRLHIMENVNRMRYFYPGYSMRLYTDLPLDNNFCRILCQNTDLFWCNIRNSIGDQSKMVAPTWKFLPLGDPSVELFLSRDLASLIDARESAAVADWIQLNKTFHLMRDKRRIHNTPILGGLWGARNDLLPGDEGDKLRTQIISLSKTPRNKGMRAKTFDQDILSRVIFYPRKKDIVAYDSYHCKQWKKFTMVRPFPVRRNHTVHIKELATRGMAGSAVVAIKKKYKLTKCPLECRPSYGKDWEYC